MTNSADSDQLASSEANWSGSTLFAKTGHVVFSKRRIKLRVEAPFPDLLVHFVFYVYRCILFQLLLLIYVQKIVYVLFHTRIYIEYLNIKGENFWNQEFAL